MELLFNVKLVVLGVILMICLTLDKYF